MDAIRIHMGDNVAVALRPLEAGERHLDVVLKQPVPQGHKFALTGIAEGGEVLKYGYRIGVAKAVVHQGEHLHTHNVRSAIAEHEEYRYEPSFVSSAPVELPGFYGYRRPDGQVGIRNELWILPLVGCVNSIAQTIAAQNQHLVQGTVEGLHAFGHPYGCSQMGDDMERTGDLLAALARNPNAGGVLVLGLGCETNTMERFKQRLGACDARRFRFLKLPGCGGRV